MRKFITIVILSILFLSLVIVATPHILSFFNLDKKITDYIISQLTKEGQEIITINDVDFGFGRIKLRGIQFINYSSNVDFVINGLQFDYSLLKLLKNLDNPHKSIDKIFLVQPRVVIKEDRTTETSETYRADTSNINLIKILNQFENINKIHLKQGEIILSKSPSQSIVLARNLNGWINSNDFSAIKIEATGMLFDANKSNFSLSSILDLTNQNISAHVQIHNFNLRNTNLIYVKDEIHVVDGSVTSDLDITSNHFSLDSIHINGSLLFKNLSIQFLNSKIEKLNVAASILNNGLRIQESRGIFDNSEFIVSAEMDNILKPDLSGKLESNNFKLKPFADLLNIRELADLIITMKSDFKISPNNYCFDFKLSAPQITYKTEILENFKADLKIENEHVDITSLCFKILGFDITSQSQFNTENGTFEGTFDATRAIDSYIFFDRIAGAQQNMQLKVKGNIKEKTLDGTWSINLIDTLDTLINFTGDIKLSNGIFSFAKNYSDSDDFLFSIEVANIFENPTINFGYIENPPIHLFTNNSWLSKYSKNYRFEGIVAGPLNHLNAQILLRDKSSPKSRLIFTSEIRNFMKTDKYFKGKLTFNNFEGKYEFSLGKDYCYGKIKSNGSLQGDINIDLKRDEQINSNISFSKINVGLFYPNSTGQDHGNLSGKLSLSGSLANPKITSHFTGDRFIFNNIGYYKFNISLNADTSHFKVDTANIALNNVPILNGRLVLDGEQQTIDARANGLNVDSDYIFQTLFGKKEIVTGSGDYSLKVTGNMNSPKSDVTVELRNGVLSDIPFDMVQIALNDSLIQGKEYFEYKNHLINIAKFVAIKGGQYHLEAQGNLPLYDGGEIDFDVKFDGDILSFIPKWDSFFLDGASFSTIQLKISGTPSRPRVVKGAAEIERGELWLKEVAEHIENISGRIEIVPGTNQVIFKNVRGEIEGKSLLINTLASVVTSDGKRLESWYLKELDLDFGILSMRTPEGGVKLGIPKLMPDGEYGTLALAGKTSAEDFYFAGPVSEPHAWGMVTFADSRFTFPFPESESGKPTKAVQFLKGIHWDVDVLAGMDLHYVKTIPGFLGEVDTELSIDPRSQGLTFNGVINNNTFRPVGELYSSRGRLDYLDLNFRVESFGVIFNKIEEKPEVYGRAMTTVRDSIGAGYKTIYLELVALDRETGQESRRSRWEDFRFKLISADPTIGESQEQVLSYLGYSVDNIKEKATEVGGAVTENYIIRPLLKPLEKQLERYLGFDLVRFNSRITQNLFLASLGETTGYTNIYDKSLFYDTISPYAVLFESSEVTVGKYLSKDLYLSYTGKLVAVANHSESEFNFSHSLGLEYRFYQNLLIEFEYDREIMRYYHLYPSKPYLEDFRIRLRHSFSF